MDFIRHMERAEAMEYYNADTLAALDTVIALMRKEYETDKEAQSKGEDRLIYKRTEVTGDAKDIQEQWYALYELTQELSRTMRMIESLDKLREKVETKVHFLEMEEELQES